MSKRCASRRDTGRLAGGDTSCPCVFLFGARYLRCLCMSSCSHARTLCFGRTGFLTSCVRTLESGLVGVNSTLAGTECTADDARYEWSYTNTLFSYEYECNDEVTSVRRRLAVSTATVLVSYPHAVQWLWTAVACAAAVELVARREILPEVLWSRFASARTRSSNVHFQANSSFPDVPRHWNFVNRKIQGCSSTNRPDRTRCCATTETSSSP